MSQQMHFDEEPRGYQATYTPPVSEGRDPGSGYAEHFDSMPGQKIGSSYSGRAPSPGQRLALAIVSLVILLGGIAMFSDSSVSLSANIIKLVALIFVCIAAIIINIVFNLKRNW